MFLFCFVVFFSFVLPGQVSSEAKAAPIISEEGRVPSRKKKPRVLEPGALVIEHAEPTDAGQSELLVHILPAGGAACSEPIRVPSVISLSAPQVCTPV